MKTLPPSPNISPRWGPTAKLIVGLSFVGLVVALVIYSRSFIGPLLLAFILTYLLHPVAATISRVTRLSWRMTVNLMYLILAIILLGSFALTGLAVFEQTQNLVQVVQNFVNNLPTTIADLSTHSYAIGRFQLNLSQLDLQTISNQLLSYVQPLLGRVGTLVSTFATSTAVTIGWGIFVLLVSYFILADATQVTEELLYIQIPGYDADMRRLGYELRKTWNAFLRGQLIILVLVIIVYTIAMSILGVRYFYAIALLAGLAKFLPYIGPFITWTITALVTYFQGGNYFGLQPWQYTIMVLVVAVLIDQIFDNLVSPRLIGQTLGVHPAAVLIAAFIGTNLIGFVGLLLAAPVVATLKMLGGYAVRKMLDLDPWPLQEEPVPRKTRQESRLIRRLQAWYRAIRQRRFDSKE